jgi:hypothetical protein
MNKEQKQLAVIGVGVVILVIVLAGNAGKRKARVPVAAAPAQSAAQLPAEHAASRDLQSPDGVQTQQGKRAEAPWGRDPFVSSSSAAAGLDNLKLKGITIGANGSGFAAINDEIVKVGETVGGFQLKEIAKDKVLLQKGAQSFYLAFPDDGSL